MDLRKPNLNGIGLFFHLTLGNGFIKSAETVTPKLEMSFGVYIIYIVTNARDNFRFTKTYCVRTQYIDLHQEKRIYRLNVPKSIARN